MTLWRPTTDESAHLGVHGEPDGDETANSSKAFVDPFIESAKGLVILLVVLTHVVGVDKGAALEVSDGFWRDLNDVLAFARMPLFTFLSGYVYSIRPVGPHKSIKSFVAKKARRILIPLLVAGTTFAAIQSFVDNGNIQWHQLHLKPVTHFWFIQSIFIIYLIVALLDRYGLLATRTRVVTWFLVAALVGFGGAGTDYLSLAGVAYLMPYFILGLGCFRFRWKITSRSMAVLCGLGALGFLILERDELLDQIRTSPIRLAFGALFCVVMISAKLENSLLIRIGGLSYGIYLFHVFFTAATRIALDIAGIDSLLTHILFGLVAGTVGPMVIERSVQGWRYLELLLFGKWKAKTGSLPR